jgi:glycosyltransferase involved in cell wall biosynthesis
MMKNLTLVIPAKYEKESLPFVLDEIKNFKFKIKIVLQHDDLETIKSIVGYNCEVIYQKGSGYGNALIEGINSVETEYFCIFNADGSFNPKEITPMYNLLTQNQVDFIFGSRYQKNSSSDDDTLITYIGNFFFTRLGKILFKLPLTDILYTFVLGKTKSFKLLNCKKNDFSFCIELPILANTNKMKILNSNCFERNRIGGKKKVNAIRDGFLILKHMIYLYFNRQ